MSLPRPKKKKLLILLSLVSSLAASHIGNEEVDTIDECIAGQVAKSLVIFDGDEEGENWTTAQQAVYDAADALSDGYDSEGEVDFDYLSGVLGEALNGL